MLQDGYAGGVEVGVEVDGRCRDKSIADASRGTPIFLVASTGVNERYFYIYLF